MAGASKTCTFEDAKDFLLTKVSEARSKGKKRPNKAQITVCRAVTPAPCDDCNEVYPNVLLGNS